MAQQNDPNNFREVLVKINDDNNSVSGQGGDLRAKEPKLSLVEENPADSLGQRCSDLADTKDNQLSSNCKEVQEDMLLCSSSTAARKNASWWRTKTKSNRVDPPTEHDRQAKSAANPAAMGKSCRRKKFGIMLTLLQWVSFILLVSAFICSLSIPVIKRRVLWDLPLWKWELMILVLICGRLVSGWGIRLLVFYIQSNVILRTRVLYFVYGLKKSVQNCLWLGLVLAAWEIIFNEKIEKVTKSKVLRYVTKGLLCLLVGTSIWLLKTLLVKVLASSFHVKAYFERIEKAFFNQAVIKKLLASASTETDNMFELNSKGVSPERMNQLIQNIQDFHLLDEQPLDSDDDADESGSKGKAEHMAKNIANRIFQNAARTNSKYICSEDLNHFMNARTSSRFMRSFEGAANSRGIDKLSFEEWMVNALTERKALKSSLKDTDTAVDDLHYLLNVLVAIVIVIIWLLMFRVALFHFAVLLLSQLLVVVFVFGNTVRTTFEAIIFLFVMHPYDVGDCCEVDGVQMVVKEMNILTTVFLRGIDSQKIIYPNVVLATKPIINYYRSPDMGETVDFCIHISTPAEKVAAMKQRIKEYIQSKNDHWHPNPTVMTLDVVDMNRLKMVVRCRHRMNRQDTGERLARRACLLEKMIEVFKELDVEYRMLPLDMNVRQIPGSSSDRLPSIWTTCAPR